MVKAKKERETEYMSRLDVPSCLKEDFELIIDDIFTIMGVGTVATGNILTGMCREGENACIYKANGDILETRITTVDVHTKERKANGCGYKTAVSYTHLKILKYSGMMNLNNSLLLMKIIYGMGKSFMISS